MNEELQKTSLRNAEKHLAAMKALDFTEIRRMAEDEQTNARTIMENVKLMSLPVEKFKQQLELTEERLASLAGKIADITSKSSEARDLYKEANRINFGKNKNPEAS